MVAPIQQLHQVEHRLFSFITRNWRGNPLITHQVTAQLAAVRPEPHVFPGDWNDTMHPTGTIHR
jgi:hypothetical protein